MQAYKKQDHFGCFVVKESHLQVKFYVATYAALVSREFQFQTCPYHGGKKEDCRNGCNGTCAQKQVLYFSQDHSDCVYILKEGKVKIYRNTPDGKEIILNIVNPGELFGELCVAGLQEREEIAEVLDSRGVRRGRHLPSLKTYCPHHSRSN